jgi:hypothetical protein
MSMQRREFLTASCVAGFGSLAGGAALGQDQPTRLPNESEAAFRARLVRIKAAEEQGGGVGGRAFYELRRYEIETPEQKVGFDKFLSEAAIPALNRLGCKPVGVFYPEKELSPIYVLIPHRSLMSFAMLTQTLSQDQEFLQAGAEVIDAPADKPAYKNLETQLMVAFEGMPQIETPITSEGRVLQLRTYESPSEKAGLKKIEMFNTAEIAVFRKVGLHPVFFGQTLAGVKMPNLTYMLVFKDMQEQQENWKKFGADPDWQKLRVMPEYMDKEIIRNKGITNLILKPAAYSQI